MYLLIIFLPFLSFFCLFNFGFLLGGNGSIFLCLCCMIFSLVITLLSYYEVVYCGAIVKLDLFSWFSFKSVNLEIYWNFLFDSLTLNLCLIIILISTLVHIYSLSYMKADPYLIKFLAYLSFFTFCMLILISSGNYIQMFLGWEGVGLASYLLISFWHTRKPALQAALKAMLLNRIGDICLLIAFVYIYFVFGTFNYDDIFCVIVCEVCNINNTYLQIICLFIFLGAMGKSAQLGLHTWLPDAMEGPTPVSALIHAATMVTAGVFLVIRSSFIVVYSIEIQHLIVVIGCLTAFFAASVALFQNDIKKIIAYSTCSQLGYMFFSCGLLNFEIGLFHLVNHAFFKALLFLSSGVIIHAVLDEQDMRKFGGFLKFLPVTYIMVCIGSLALVGFPFFSGFYSKDIILELSLGNYTFFGTFSYGLGVIGALFTAFYSFRLLNLTFIIKPNLKTKLYAYTVHEGCIIMLITLLVLGFFSVFFGFIFKELFLGIGSDVWLQSMFFSISNIFEIEWIAISLKNIPFIFTLFGLFSSYLFIDFYNYIPIFYRKFILYKIFNFYAIFLIIKFFGYKWYFDLLYAKLAYFLLCISYLFLNYLDRGLLEYVGPLSLIYFFRFYFFKLISLLNSGYIYHYSYLFIFCIVYTIIVLKIILILY